MTDLPSIPFSIGMASSNASPPFPLLRFDDGAAIPLHAILPLAAELGISLPHSSLFDVLRNWNENLPSLAHLVNVLAYDDRALGHRGHFHPLELYDPELLLPDTRQIFKVTDHEDFCLPITVQGGAGSTLTLGKALRDSKPAFALAAIVGRRCYGPHTDLPIAGWSLAATFVSNDPGNPPGSLILGPVLQPDVFRSEERSTFVFGLMGRPVQSGSLAPLIDKVIAGLKRISQYTLLLPGDVVVAQLDPDPDSPSAAQIDMMEAAAPDLGRLRTSFR